MSGTSIIAQIFVSLSTTHDRTVTKDKNYIILNGPCNIIQEKVISESTKQIETDVIEKGHAKQTRTRKLKEYKTFQKLKVMKGRQIHRDDFEELQNKGETLKWVRKRTKSEEKKT